MCSHKDYVEDGKTRLRCIVHLNPEIEPREAQDSADLLSLDRQFLLDMNSFPRNELMY